MSNQRRQRMDDHDHGDSQSYSSRRRRQAEESDASEDVADGDVDMEQAGGGFDNQLVKKLVRYALACEYARVPIRRDGIRDKVLGSNARSFRRVFDEAQKELKQIFGMEMVELPVKEKRTLAEKKKDSARKGASQSGNSSSRAYVLVSRLPSAFVTQPVVAPSRVPSSEEEASYVAFYTMIISLICLNGGQLSEQKLKRYLARLNASENTPMDRTEQVLQKMARQGYVDKVVEKTTDATADDDNISWFVGSRGKTEVPPQSVAAFVEQVWGEVPDDFQQKLFKSLGLVNLRQMDQDAG